MSSRSDTIKTIVLLLLLAVGLVYCLVPWVGGSLPQAKVAPLTIDETVGLIFVLGHERAPGFVSRMNPAARPIFQKILADPGMSDWHRSAIVLLGYIGNEEDAAMIRDQIRALRGQLSNEEGLLLHQQCTALGLLSARGSRVADEALQEMLDRKFWRSRDLYYFGNDYRQGWGDDDQCIYLVSLGLAYSGRFDPDAILAKVLPGARDEETAKSLKANYQGKSFPSMAEWQARETVAPNPNTRAMLPSCWNRDPNNPQSTYPSHPLTPITRCAGDGMIRESVKHIPALRKGLLDWREGLREGSTKPMAHLWGLSQSAGKLRLHEFMPLLIELDELSLKVNGRHDFAVSIAQAGGPTALPYLKKLLASPAIQDRDRYEVATALLELGDKEGREFLLKCYRAYLDELRQTGLPHEYDYRYLRRIDDAEFLAELKKLRGVEQDAKVQRSLQAMIDRIELNRASADDLLAIARNSRFPENETARYDALRALGRQGRLSDTVKLMELEPWQSTLPPDQLKKHDQRLNVMISFAIDAIAYRRWREWPEAADVVKELVRMQKEEAAP